MAILEEIKAKKTYLKKSDVAGGDEFLITITYNNKTISFNYHDNSFNSSGKKRVLGTLLKEINNCNEKSKAKIAFNKLFNEAEQKQLQQELEGWY